MAMSEAECTGNADRIARMQAPAPAASSSLSENSQTTVRSGLSPGARMSNSTLVKKSPRELKSAI